MSNDRYKNLPETNFESEGLNPPTHRVDVDEQYPGEARDLYSKASANLVNIICIKRGTEFSEKLAEMTIALNKLAYEYEKWV